MTVRPPTLFWRLMAAISLVLVLGAGALAYAAYDYANTAANDAYDRLLLGAASQISETIRVEDGVITTDIPVSAFETLSASRRERVFYRVTGPGGVLVTGYGDLEVPRALARPGPEHRVWDAVYRGLPVRAAAQWRYVPDPAASGWATVTVAQTRTARDGLARDLTARAMLLVGVMSVIALGGAAMAVRYALRPLHRIEDALGARDPNDLTPLDMQVPAEIEELVQSINRFMGRLSERMDSLQHLIADAAHQIRTPVTALSAQVELLQRETDPDRRRNQLERIDVRTRQIGRLVSQLLSQAMISHRAESITATRVDLAEILDLAIQDAVPASMPRDLSVETRRDNSPMDIEGDAVSLREAIRNIVENAVHHGARSRIVASACTRDNGDRVIEIADDGPGIALDLLPDATKRFVRGSPDSAGSGLGLSIVEDVARNHGARLEFAAQEDGLFRVRLVFPARRAMG